MASNAEKLTLYFQTDHIVFSITDSSSKIQFMQKILDRINPDYYPIEKISDYTYVITPNEIYSLDDLIFRVSLIAGIKESEN